MARYNWNLLTIGMCTVLSIYCGSEEEEDPSPERNAGVGFTPLEVCPTGTVKHISASGSLICCPEHAPYFCDENTEGYPGGCWEEQTDCDLITQCGGLWAACPTGSLPHCNNDTLECRVCTEGSTEYTTKSGAPICCDAEAPTFCDETSEGYHGGCWATGVDCGTISLCGGQWVGCSTGLFVICDDATNQYYCSNVP